MTSNDYAITLTIFSLAYAVFEVPSNWVMKHHVRPSAWLAFLLGCWGAVTLGFAGVHNYAQVLSLRLLIGIFEAGFFPGIVYLITIWYRHDERSLRIALVIAFCNLAGAFGGAIAFGIGHVNGAGGLQGFRWLFIIEGIITMISVVPTLLVLPDYPSRAGFLGDDDKRLAVSRLKERGGGYQNDHATRGELVQTFFAPRMMAHYVAYASLPSRAPCPRVRDPRADFEPSPGCQCRLSGLLHLLLAHHRHGLGLPVHPGTTPHRAALGGGLLRRHRPVLLGGPLRRPRLARRRGVRRRRRGLAGGRPPPGGRLHAAVRVLVPRRGRRVPVRARDDELGDLQHPEPPDVGPPPRARPYDKTIASSCLHGYFCAPGSRLPSPCITLARDWARLSRSGSGSRRRPREGIPRATLRVLRVASLSLQWQYCYESVMET